MVLKRQDHINMMFIFFIAMFLPLGMSAQVSELNRLDGKKNVCRVDAAASSDENVEKFDYDFEIDGLYFDIDSYDKNTVTVSSVAEAPVFPDELYESPDYPCPEFDSQVKLNSRWLDENGTLSIPAKVQNGDKEYTVTTIGYCGFMGNKDIQKLELPNTLERIEECAFLGCFNLKEVTMPESLGYIHERAFSYTAIEEIKIPDNFWFIGDFAFCNCRQLKKFDTKTFEFCFRNHGVLAGCTSLDELIIPSGLNYIDDYSLYGIPNIAINLDGVSWIGRDCFKGNNTFRQVELSTGRLGSCSFMDCENLWHFTFESRPTLGKEVCPGSPLKLITAMGQELLRIPEGFPHVSEYPLDATEKYESYPFFELWDIKISDYLTYNEGYFDNYSRLDFGSNADDVELYLNPGADEYDDNPYAQLHEKATLLVPRDTPFKLAWKAAGEYICELPYLNDVEIKDVEKVGDMNVVSISGIKEDSKFFVKAINSKVETLTEESALYDIYSIDGLLLKSNVSDRELDTLPPGIYLLRGGDKTVKIIR